MTKASGPSEREFDEAVAAAYKDRAPDFSKTLTIAVVGQVSSGKSSLINAFLRRGRDNPVAVVGARSGVTRTLQVFPLDEHVCIIDSPGLGDVEQANSEITKKFLESIDVGILVVTGSVDASQKVHVDELRPRCKKMFVVLNKADAWDHLVPSELADVVAQWQSALGIDRLYPTCTKGFDPKTRPDIEPDIRGVDELRSDVEDFVEAEGKALLLARQMGKKRDAAAKIIVGALVAVAAEAFVPGSAALITATQAVAIASLYYLYTGKVLSMKHALSAMPAMAAETAAETVFLWLKSVLPPTFVLDVAAAGVAVAITGAMLIAISALFATGAELHVDAGLKRQFRDLHVKLVEHVRGAGWEDLKSRAFWQKIIHDLMY